MKPIDIDFKSTGRGVRRLTRCDSNGVPKTVQFIEYDWHRGEFTVRLFDGTYRVVSVTLIGEWSGQISDRIYNKVESLFRRAVHL